MHSQQAATLPQKGRNSWGGGGKKLNLTIFYDPLRDHRTQTDRISAMLKYHGEGTAQLGKNVPKIILQEH